MEGLSLASSIRSMSLKSSCSGSFGPGKLPDGSGAMVFRAIPADTGLCGPGPFERSGRKRKLPFSCMASMRSVAPLDDFEKLLGLSSRRLSRKPHGSTTRRVPRANPRHNHTSSPGNAGASSRSSMGSAASRRCSTNTATPQLGYLVVDDVTSWATSPPKPKAKRSKPSGAAETRTQAFAVLEEPRVLTDHFPGNERPSKKQPSRRALTLEAAVFDHSHPTRGSRGSEDASLIEGQWVAVADGVSGWAEQGVNSGMYCQELLWNCAESIRGTGFSDSDTDSGQPAGTASRARGGQQDASSSRPSSDSSRPSPTGSRSGDDWLHSSMGELWGAGGQPSGRAAEPSGGDAGQGRMESGWGVGPSKQQQSAGARPRRRSKHPKGVLVDAHARTELKGSCTVTLACLEDDRLAVASVGDSGFVVLRQGAVVAQSMRMQHGFDVPFHIGLGVGDDPACAMEYVVHVQAGDILVLGTDGLFDNLFLGEIVHTATEALLEGCSPEVSARRLACAALKKSQSTACHTPYSEAAKLAGRQHMGGKADDITALVAFIR